jgi:hypothetical protein
VGRGIYLFIAVPVIYWKAINLVKACNKKASTKKKEVVDNNSF